MNANKIKGNLVISQSINTKIGVPNSLNLLFMRLKLYWVIVWENSEWWVWKDSLRNMELEELWSNECIVEISEAILENLRKFRWTCHNKYWRADWRNEIFRLLNGCGHKKWMWWEVNNLLFWKVWFTWLFLYFMTKVFMSVNLSEVI